MATSSINDELNKNSASNTSKNGGMSINNEKGDRDAKKQDYPVDPSQSVGNDTNTIPNLDNVDNSVHYAPVRVEESKTYGKKILLFVLLLLAVIFGTALFSYFVIARGDIKISPFPGEEEANAQTGNGSMSKEFENPLNGMYFTSDEAEKFRENKPVAVMVNNYDVARPSSGLSSADVVYEAVAESGITRLMPIFYSRIPESVSSVRSARYYFVELAAGYKAHYFHWGAAHVPPCQKEPATSPNYCPPVGGKVETDPEVDAYDRIVKMGVPNLDGGNYSCDGENCAFSRDPNKVGKIPLEHTAFVRLPLALELAKEVRPDPSWHKYVPVTKWLFKDDAPLEERGDIGLATPIVYNYWDLPAFEVKWVYNKDDNTYTRYQGGVKQIDALNNEDLKAKVVVVRFTKQESVGDKKAHLYHELVGTGEALIFQDGKVIEGKWSRTKPDENDIYSDANGNQLELTRGQIWVQLVPVGNKVAYQVAATPVETQATPP